MANVDFFVCFIHFVLVKEHSFAQVTDIIKILMIMKY